jgi:hydrogenase maturation protease
MSGATAANATGPGRILVAGIGNVFFGDDGFGVEVVLRLAAGPVPRGVEIKDIGIRGVHLAFELLDGVAKLILVDAAARGEAPGTVSLVEIDRDGDPGAAGDAVSLSLDPHGFGPGTVLALIDSISAGADIGRVLLVACEPLTIEPQIGLSEPVRAAVDDAVRLVCELCHPYADSPDSAEGVQDVD